MNERGKSDRSIRAKKSSNKESGAPRSAEGMEQRDLAKGNSDQQTRTRAQHRQDLQLALTRVRQVALRERELRFTTLWHHVYDPKRLRETYFSLKRRASSGVDGVTWQEYGQKLETNLEDLSDRLQRGAYRAKPVRRTYIPKADGRRRPIGIPTLEDKVVQRCTAEVLGAVFETDFLGFSYGFRPGRKPHDALDAVTVGIKKRRVNWILDADIRGFFDAINHDWLMKFVEHRIQDQRVLRHIKKWLNAGVLEDGKLTRSVDGTPQGGSISPLLANIYLHHVFDLWAKQWRKRNAHGDVIIVRYADDFIVGFEHRADAERFLAELKLRFAKFNLELHPDKTRLLEFGRFAAKERKKRGDGKPETFDFLGFTHMCSQTKQGWFQVRRKTMRSRVRMKLKAVKARLRFRLHDPVPEVGRWLAAVVRGHVNYYGVPDNSQCIRQFRMKIGWLWFRSLRRRSNKSTLDWNRMERLMNTWIPFAHIQHPYPEQRLCVIT